MIIEIDDRENKTGRADRAKKTYRQHDTEVKHLKTGDYIFNQQVAFEYKTLPDFISSVNSGRLVEQAIRLNKEFKYPFVVIQYNEEELEAYLRKLYFLRKTRKQNKPQKFGRKNFYGAIDSLNTYVTVINRPTEHYCLQGMLNTAIKCLRQEPVNRKVVKTGNACYNYLRYCIDGVGQKTAQKIVNELDLSKPIDVFRISVEDLSGIRGISEKKATLIYNNINQ